MEIVETGAEVMKKTKNFINLGSISRKDADDLLAILCLEGNRHQELINQIKSELSPYYEYDIPCQDCSRIFTITSKTIISDDRLSKGGICSYCSDDYK